MRQTTPRHVNRPGALDLFLTTVADGARPGQQSQLEMGHSLGGAVGELELRLHAIRPLASSAAAMDTGFVITLPGFEPVTPSSSTR